MDSIILINNLDLDLELYWIAYDLRIEQGWAETEYISIPYWLVTPLRLSFINGTCNSKLGRNMASRVGGIVISHIGGNSRSWTIILR
jgi:hypothetical protein